MKKLFNDQWQFIEKPLQTNFVIADAIGVDFQPVELPHDWLITEVNDLYRDSEGWYLKEFQLDQRQLVANLFLEFDGIYLNSSVYVNGKLISEWKNGSTPQVISLNDAAQVGENTIFVRVRYQAPNARWYTGAGINRDVWLHILPATYCPPHGNYWHAEPSNPKQVSADWVLTIQTEIKSNTHKNSGEVNYTLYDDQHQLVYEFQQLFTPSDTKIQSRVEIMQPKLWSPDQPTLYQLITTIKSDGGEQKLSNSIAFRQLQYQPNNGVLLNGNKIKFQGVCEHEDYGLLGGAVREAAIEKRLRQLKAMGVNALRTAHNPFSSRFLTAADQMGFLVMSEFSDVWRSSKTDYDYAHFFDKCWDKDVTAWIRRDREHPAIVLWSIGNEIYDTHGREDGLQTALQLSEKVRELDPLSNAEITFASNYLLWEPTQRVADKIKIVGYNYGENLYTNEHSEHPDWCIYGSETGSIASSRGIYHFPLEKNILADDDQQCSSLGNSATSWGARDLETCLLDDLNNPYTLGQFLWTGHDYIGEPTPYHTKSAYLGQIDTAGIPKDSYYVCQAAWVPVEKKAMIHIFPYWDFNPGQKIDIRVTTNAQFCELFFNGKSLGKRDNGILEKRQLIQNWQLPYEPGTLTAVAYSEGNQIVAQDKVGSFGDVTQLSIDSSRDQLKADGQDIAFLTIRGLDKNGEFVANATNRIHVTVKGGGRIIGVDNGDSTDYDEYFGTSRRLFSGTMVVAIASTNVPSRIQVIITSPQLPLINYELSSIAAERISGYSQPVLSAPESSVNEEIPIRKIELVSTDTQGLIFNQQSQKKVLHAIIKPENATFPELTWRVTDNQGITTSLATIHKKGRDLLVTPVANGTGYIRCLTTNGRDKVAFYSMIDFNVTGHKQAYLNPYSGVSGGLYTHSNVSLTAGNERGVATLRGERSEVTFSGVDFGADGSDHITLSLFPLDPGTVPIELWEGIPDKADSRLIDRLEYTRGSIWNTYQDQTFILSTRLIGIQTLTLVFQQKVHVKQFSFAKQQRAFATLNILDADLRYGDSFTIGTDRIDHIGNNVTFQFNNLDFGEVGADCIEVIGSAPQNNSIELKIGEQKTMLEFTKSKTDQIQKFMFPRVKSRQTIEFIFLPGSNFNFKSFRFYNKK